MLDWREITADDRFKKAPREAQQRMAEGYFQEFVASDDRYKEADPELQSRMKTDFMEFSLPPEPEPGLFSRAGKAIKDAVSGIAGERTWTGGTDAGEGERIIESGATGTDETEEPTAKPSISGGLGDRLAAIGRKMTAPGAGRSEEAPPLMTEAIAAPEEGQYAEGVASPAKAQAVEDLADQVKAGKESGKRYTKDFSFIDILRQGKNAFVQGALSDPAGMVLMGQEARDPEKEAARMEPEEQQAVETRAMKRAATEFAGKKLTKEEKQARMAELRKEETAAFRKERAEATSFLPEDLIVGDTRKERSAEVRKRKADHIRRLGEWIKSVEEKYPIDQESSGIIEDAVKGMMRFGPTMGISAIAPPVGFMFTFAQIAGMSYNDYRKNGVTPERAAVAAMANALVQTPLEFAGNLIQIRGIARMVKALGMKGEGAAKAAVFFEQLFKNAATEGTEEYLQQYPDEIASHYVMNPDESPGELARWTWDHLKEVHEAGLQASAPGAVGGALLFGLGAGVGKAYAGTRDLSKYITDRQRKINEDREKVLREGEEADPARDELVKPEEKGMTPEEILTGERKPAEEAIPEVEEAIGDQRTKTGLILDEDEAAAQFTPEELEKIITKPEEKAKTEDKEGGTLQEEGQEGEKITPPKVTEGAQPSGETKEETSTPDPGWDALDDDLRLAMAQDAGWAKKTAEKFSKTKWADLKPASQKAIAARFEKARERLAGAREKEETAPTAKAAPIKTGTAGKISDKTAQEINQFGFKTSPSDVIVTDESAKYINDKHGDQLLPEDVVLLKDVIESPSEVLPNIGKKGKEYRSGSVFLVRKNGKDHVVIVEITPGENNNILWNYWKMSPDKADKYLEKFRKEKARKIQPGGRPLPHVPHGAPEGAVGKPEGLSGSQAELTSDKSVTPSESDVNPPSSAVPVEGEGSATSSEKEPEAEKRPEKAPEPAPPAPTPPAEEKPKEGAATLAGHGLSIKKTATKKGASVWEVSGDTKPHKDRLKALGGKWFGPRQTWSFYKEDPTEKILGALEGKNQETMAAPGGKPEIEKTAETDSGQAFSEVALRVSDAIAKKEQITWQSLFEWGDKAFGGTQAEGRYTPKDAYDALEIGINKYLFEKSFLTVRPNLDGIEETQNQVKALKDGILEKIPTQSKRTEEQDEFQQFSTPPPFAFLANWVANIGESDTVLEPSAGTGNLAVFAKIAGANVVLNELSKRRAALLRNLNLGTVYTENAEHLHAILPKSVKPTVVVMNPPFSSTAGRLPGRRDTSIGAEHVEQALKRLEPGGRLVAIVGKGMAPDAPAFREWWKKIRSEYKVLANVGVSGDEYRKYGTTFDNRLIVIDKTGKTDTMELTGSVDKVEDLVPLLKGVRDARNKPETGGRSEQTPAEPGGLEGAEKSEGARGESLPVRPATGGLGHGGERGQPGGPIRSIEPGASPVRGGSEGRDEVSDQAAGGGRGVRSVSPGEGGRSGGPGVGDTGSPVVQANDRNRTETLLDIERRDKAPSKEELSDSKIFDEYKPQATIRGAKSHPGKLEESAAMAAISLPSLTYTPALPKKIVDEGRLSDAQLEAVLYAGQSHKQFLPGTGGARMGFFVGDGTGVGKGREIAAIIWDNYLQGRKKAVWVSQNQPLINDAKRDVEGVGWNPGLLVDLGKAKLGSEIKNEEGIAFLGYGLLASKSKRDESISRLNQLTSWLGEDFDGVIVFDEAHNLANALTTKGSRGRKAAAQKALAGIELQARFPKARIVYVSATGATEVSNLSYCDRLGLWGYGTAFADKRDFIENIAGSGVAAMEMVAQNLKAMGRYMARSLSFDGVSYSSLEHPLNEDQRVAYDKSAEAWQVVLNNVHAAIEATKANKKQKANAMSAFWGAHQRFFNQIITSMQMPSVIKALEKDLAEGNAPVLQLVNTNEAQLNRSLQDRREEDETEDLDLTPLEQLIGYVRNTFPVQQYQEVEDEDGNVRNEPVKDSKGNPVENPKAVEMRDRLLDELESLKRFIPDGPLDMLVNHFGHENIAEVTGRTKRLITTTDEKGTRRVVEKWSKSRSMVDADAFQNDKKHILVFSQAGGTGRSYHADLTAKNQRLRKHYLVQPGWRADVAVQGFGRSHRSNQAQPPEYVLVTTDLKGQKRFISSVARRLDQLGALTKGQRQAGSQGFFGAEDNLENIHAHHGLGDLINDVYGGKVQGISIDNLEAETGLKFTDQDGNLLRNPVPPMTQFLNRILSMKIETQNRVFDLFAERMRNRIERARAEGTLDVGLETVRAKRIDKLQEVAVHTDEQSGAETKYMEFEITNDAPKLTFENSAGHAKGGYARNNRSGRVYAVSSPRFRTDPETGEVVEMVGLLGANYSGHNIPAADLNDPEKYSRIAGTEAKDLWETELNALPSEIKSRRHLVTGALLPIWDRLPADEIPRIFRLRSSDGQTHLGRLIPEKHLQRTLERIGATATAQDFAPADVYRGVYDEGKEFVLANDWRIRRRRVSGDYRIELVGPFFRHDNMLKGLGVFMERIQYATRYFIPVDPAKGVRALEGILKQSPVVNTRGGQQVAVEPSEIDRYSLRGSSPQGGNKSFAQQLDDFQAGRLGKREVLTVGETPAVLEMLGAEQRPLVMTQAAIRKDTGGRHTLPIEALKDLPLLLEDPIMVFDSATQPNSLVVVTELKHDGKTVVAAVHLSKEDGRNVVHEIASVYGKDSHTIFAKWINDGLLRYMNKKKSREWAVTAGLQLPGVRGTIQGFKKKILFEYDLVKKKNELDALRKESGIGEAETVLSEQDTKALLRILGKRVRGLTIYTNDEGVTYIRTRGGKRVAVKTVRADRLKPDRVAVELYDEGHREGDVRGGYSNKTKTVYLAKGKGDFWTLTHEFYHFLEDAGVISAMDREILTRHIRGLVKKGAFETRNKNDIGGDEDRAFFAETRLAGEPYDIESPIGRILENIRELIDTILNALGIRTARGVMRDIRTGKIHDRAGAAEEGNRRTQYRMTDQANTPAFKKWFGASKVVDKNGKPKIMYHGSEASFSNFFISGMDLGAHFGPSHQANVRIGSSPKSMRETIRRGGPEPHQEGRQVYPVYLKIQDPLRLPDMDEWNDPDQWLKRYDELPEGLRDDIQEAAFQAKELWEETGDPPEYFAGDVRSIIQEAGYDGVVYKNKFEGGGLSWIAFYPEQIKSATGNIGTFDAENPDIRYRLAPPAAADSALPEHVRERWEQSRGVPRRPVLDWAREKLQHFKEGTAHFPALQRIADKKLRGALSDLLRTHQEIPQYASEIAIRRLGEWTGNLAPGQSNIYEENIILADLVRDIESGLLTEGEGSWLKEGPFGFRTTDEVRDAFDKAQEMAGRDPAVSDALKKRTDFIRELKQDLVDYKILKPEVLDSQDYYHHQVLIHWGDFRGTGTGSRDVRKHWRPWMAARTGSVHDYNTQYFEAEFTAIAQQLAQVETARTLKRLKEMADEYDACKKKEKAENRKLFYRKWSAMHGGATVIPGDKDTDPLFQFKQKIAMAAGKLEKMAKNGELEYDSEWSDIIDGIAAGAAIGEPRFFHFLSHLMNRQDPGALQAATIFKAIQDRNKMIDEVLGKDKLAWQHFVPEEYVQWKPDPNKGWFWANTYTDAILQKIAAGEIRPEDAEARKVLAKGRAYIWVIPEGLAETLDKFNPSGALGDDAGMLARLAAKSLAAWKQYILINPVRVLKYNTNNASGDADICIAYAPEILKPKYGHKAMTDLVAWHRRQHDKLDPDTRAELEKARRLGVLGSGFAVQEVEDVMKIIPDERHLKNLLAGEKLNILQKYWQGAREFTTWRENILRLAAYRFFRDSLKKGKGLYGASNPAEIDAIADPDEKAAKLARELLGDYGNISAHGQYIRKRMIPFASWLEINAPRYVYMLRNLKYEDRAAGAPQRMAAVTGRKMLAGGAKFVLRAGLLYGAVMLYNAIVWPDEEEKLGEMGRQQLHLILGRREDGSIVTLRFQGALSDALAWFDGENLPKDIADLTKGRRTLQEKLIDIPKAILNRIVQGFRPDIKAAAEVATGYATFPDVTRPRPIYDTAEHILRTFSLDAPYRWAAGKPKRGGSTAGMLFQDIQKMLLYEADPSEQAYYDVRRMVNEWNEKRGKEPTYGGSPNRKGKALYYYKQALRYGDFKAAEKYLAKYQALGGNWKGLHQSIRMAHPLAGVKQELRYNFRKGLSEAEEATLQRALEFYRKHYLARGNEESATGR